MDKTSQSNRRSCIPSSYILSFAKFKKLHDQKYCTPIITFYLHLQRREHNLLNDDRLFRSRRRSKSGLENKSGSYLSRKSWKGQVKHFIENLSGLLMTEGSGLWGDREREKSSWLLWEGCDEAELLDSAEQSHDARVLFTSSFDDLGGIAQGVMTVLSPAKCLTNRSNSSILKNGTSVLLQNKSSKIDNTSSECCSKLCS